MPSSKDPDHDDARDEGGHILERGQKRFDIVRDLLRGDHQHRDCERKGYVNESFPAASSPARASEIRRGGATNPAQRARLTQSLHRVRSSARRYYRNAGLGL